MYSVINLSESVNISTMRKSYSDFRLKPKGKKLSHFNYPSLISPKLIYLQKLNLRLHQLQITWNSFLKIPSKLSQSKKIISKKMSSLLILPLEHINHSKLQLISLYNYPMDVNGFKSMTFTSPFHLWMIRLKLSRKWTNLQAQDSN